MALSSTPYIFCHFSIKLSPRISVKDSLKQLLIFTDMKKFFVTLMAAFAMLIAGNTAKAQKPQFDPAQMAQMRVDHMKETLKINKDQATKLLELFKKESEEMMKMFEGGGMPDMSKIEENMKKQDEAIKKVLTAEQYKKYAEEQKAMREQFGGGF